MNNESEAKRKRLEQDWEVMVSAASNLISHFMKDGLKWSFVQVHSDCGYIGMDAWRYFIIQGRGLVKDNWILVDWGQEWTIKLEGRHTCRDVQLNALSTQNHICSVAPKPLFFNHGTSRSSRYLLPIMPLMPWHGYSNIYSERHVLDPTFLTVKSKDGWGILNKNV